MPTIDLHVATVVQPLGDGSFLQEPLLFPEICCLGDELPRLQRVVKNLVTRLVVDLAPVDLHRRRLPGSAEVGFVEVTLTPPVRSLVWQDDIVTRLPVVRWTHPAPVANDAPLPVPEAYLAFVPSLQIEAFAARSDLLEATLQNHIRAALMRTKATTLAGLVWLQRCREIQVVRFDCAVDLKTPKQLGREEVEQRDEPQAVLGAVGVDLTREALRPAYEMDSVIERLAEILTGPEPRSVLLVGSSGVGKTAAVHEMVRRRAALGLAATPFWATTGSRLVSGMSGFGIWQERCAKLCREASSKRAILHFGNLLELMEVGKSEYQSQGIGSFLRPYLGRGDLLAITECTPEQLPVIERQEPHLLSVFAQVNVAEPTREQSRTILEKVATDANAGALPITLEALAQLDRLHRRYAAYSAYPGRPLRFLGNLLADRPAGSILAPSDVTKAFSSETGLPLCLLEESERLDLAQTRSWLGQRVIGQAEPVDLVVDLLATIKAGLTRPRKPIASLLFIGPTGVGKTEMAKALAEFLFGSKQRLTRFDMSEYADPQAVARLVGGSGLGEGLLTARIREQPFAVLLLDEIEKAHGQLFDLLLQVLGEGRLTDSSGRVADFCNSVVIMTSNLGAESFQQGSFGLARNPNSSERAREHFLEAVQEFFRPELFNRIDRVIPFGPLDEETLLRIAHRQLDLIRQRDGIHHRGVSVDLGSEVAPWLARRGVDARYGARPLKRVMDRELLAPLAEKLNGYLADTPLRAHMTVEDDALQSQVKAIPQDASISTPRADAETVTACMDLRRELQKLFRSSTAREMDNEIHRLQLLEERSSKNKRVTADDVRRLSQLAVWREIRAGFDQLFAEVCTLENQGLLGLLGEGPFHGPTLEEDLRSARLQADKWLLALYLQRFDKPNGVLVTIFSEHPPFLLTLGEAYFRIASTGEGRADLWQFLPGKRNPEKDESVLLQCRLILDANLLWKQADNIPMRVWDHDKKLLRPEERVNDPFTGVIGLGLVIRAAAALPRFIDEGGLHYFRTAQASGNCLVDTSDALWQNYQPPPGMDRRGSIGGQERRRSYDLVRGIVEDVRLPGKLYATMDNLAVVLGSALDQCLSRNLKGIVNE